MAPIRKIHSSVDKARMFRENTFCLEIRLVPQLVRLGSEETEKPLYLIHLPRNKEHGMWSKVNWARIKSLFYTLPTESI